MLITEYKLQFLRAGSAMLVQLQGVKQVCCCCLLFVVVVSFLLQSPRDASLLLRGLKTLSVRTERQSETAHHLALFLSTHPAVCQVNYPGLPSHPEHHIAKRLMTKFGSVLSFVVVGGQHAAVTVANVSRSADSFIYSHLTLITSNVLQHSSYFSHFISILFMLLQCH